jgi:hypothetical protein
MEEQLSFCFDQWAIGPWIKEQEAWVRKFEHKKAPGGQRREGFERIMVYITSDGYLRIYENALEASTIYQYCYSVEEAIKTFDRMLPALKFINYV